MVSVWTACDIAIISGEDDFSEIGRGIDKMGSGMVHIWVKWGLVLGEVMGNKMDRGDPHWSRSQ